MKIKKFNNIWTMGLILFGAILIFLYIIKLIFPEYIIGVAQIPSIVKFGEYVDSHKIALYLFNGVTSFFALYFYSCACCRIKALSWLEIIIIVAFIGVSFIIQEFLPNISFCFNIVSNIAIPLIITLLRHINNIKIFYSTSLCFIITAFAQSISLAIRDISTMIAYPNTATYFILLIDLYIWNILLYNFYNFL